MIEEKEEEEEKRISRHQTTLSIIGSTFHIVSTFMSSTQRVMNGDCRWKQ